MAAGSTGKCCVFPLQIGKLKINLLPPVKGCPASYPAGRAQDAAPVLEWLENACGGGFLLDCKRQPVYAVDEQLDAGEYCYHILVPVQGERHTAPTP